MCCLLGSGQIAQHKVDALLVEHCARLAADKARIEDEVAARRVQVHGDFNQVLQSLLIHVNKMLELMANIFAIVSLAPVQRGGWHWVRQDIRCVQAVTFQLGSFDAHTRQRKVVFASCIASVKAQHCLLQRPSVLRCRVLALCGKNELCVDVDQDANSNRGSDERLRTEKATNPDLERGKILVGCDCLRKALQLLYASSEVDNLNNSE